MSPRARIGGYSGLVIDETLLDAMEKMDKAVEHVQGQFATVRTGRAAPALVERLLVDYYGSPVPLQQLASIQVPEARTLMVKPHDRNALGPIEKAIRESDLGVAPNNDGIRTLDMEASPYDLSAWGYAPVPIETADGKAEYVRRQRAFAERGQALRERLLAVIDRP